MMKKCKLKFSKYVQNISSSKNFGKFVFIVKQYIYNIFFVSFIDLNGTQNIHFGNMKSKLPNWPKPAQISDYVL